MKLALVTILLTAAVLSSPGQSPQVTVAKDLDSSGLEAVYTQEIKLWKTLQADDHAALKANLSTDFLSVRDTLQNRDQFVSSFKDCKFGPVNLQNHTTRAIGPDAIVISYRLHIEMTCKRGSVVEDSNATTTWARQKDSRWIALIHTESAINPIP